MRRLAQNMKRTAPFNELLIVLDPKIGSTGQRHLSFDHFLELPATHADPEAVEQPFRWGLPFLGPVTSAARTFHEPATTE